MQWRLNGDDLGRTREVTEEILHSLEEGITDTATAMANMPDFPRAMEEAAAGGLLGRVGLHLNLTEGTPLTTAIRDCPRFCDSDGSFNGVFHRCARSRFFLSGKEKRAVAEEARAQMERFFAYPGVWRHLDSHHHVHTDPGVFSAILPLFPGYGVTGVRLGRNLLKDASPLKRGYKALFNWRLRRLGLADADRFGRVEDLRSLPASPAGSLSVELMTHPQRDGEGRRLLDGELTMQEGLCLLGRAGAR